VTQPASASAVLTRPTQYAAVSPSGRLSTVTSKRPSPMNQGATDVAGSALVAYWPAAWPPAPIPTNTRSKSHANPAARV